MFNKKTIIIIAVALVVLIIAFFVVYKLGTKKDAIPSKADVGQDEAGTTLLSEQEIAVLTALASELHEDMDGLNWLGYNDVVYAKLPLLSDTELVALSNIFNHLYEGNSGQTFVVWLKNEQFIWGTDTENNVKNTLIRLGTLGVY